MSTVNADARPARTTRGPLTAIGGLAGAAAGRRFRTRRELDALAARVGALEAAPVQFRGIFRAGERYPKNSLVVHGGSLWFAHEATGDRPGASAEAWQMIVKKGDLDR
jgi:hypothetical protein